MQMGASSARTSVEIIASSVWDAVAALRAKADRVEVVSALSEGGLTPSDGLIRGIVALDIDHAVMVRPSSHSFVYRPDELAVMRSDLERMAEIGVRHVVLGVLGEDGLPDVTAVNHLLKGLALTATFHRAIDASHDVLQALDRLTSCPQVTHVLTSGGPGAAVDHLDTIAAMIDRTPLRVIVGSGVSEESIPLIRAALGDRRYDLHIGTAARHGKVEAVVDAKSVARLIRAARG